MPRPIGVLFGLDLSFHPFSLNPSYRQIASLPLAQKVDRMREPQFRAQLLSEEPQDPNPAFVAFVRLKTSLDKAEASISQRESKQRFMTRYSRFLSC